MISGPIFTHVQGKQRFAQSSALQHLKEKKNLKTAAPKSYLKPWKTFHFSQNTYNFYSNKNQNKIRGQRKVTSETRQNKKNNA